MDKVAAFTFSRLPREQRIAVILYEIIKGQEITKPEDIIPIAEQLAPYAVKDFVVRYGHLDDGKA